MSVTRLGLYGGPQQPYGSFAGKDGQFGFTGQVTRLGLYGGPRSPYGVFTGKSPQTELPTAGLARRQGYFGRMKATMGLG